jgi:hypothetical protein
MTVLIGKIDKKQKTVFIGTDACVTSGDVQYEMARGKFIKYPNGMCIALCGSLAVKSLIEHSDIVPEIDILKGVPITSEWIMRVFFPVYSKKLHEHNSTLGLPEDHQVLANLLIAYQDRLWKLGIDGCLIEVGYDIADDYITSGSGREQAKGAMVISSGLDPYQQVVASLKSAATQNTYCGFPVFVTATNSAQIIQFKNFTDGGKVVK